MIKSKIAFSESSKAVTAQVEVESDEMGAEDVLLMAKKLSIDAQKEAKLMTTRKYMEK